MKETNTPETPISTPAPHETTIDGYSILSEPVVLIKKLTATAIIPEYKHIRDSGADLHADIPEIVRLYPGQRMLIPTGISIELPEGYEGQVRSRSGLCKKNGVHVLNGVGSIDQGYTGEVKVILHNTDTMYLDIEPGDRIAQLVIAPVAYAQFVEVDNLSETERGDKGFGSSGVSA